MDRRPVFYQKCVCVFSVFFRLLEIIARLYPTGAKYEKFRCDFSPGRGSRHLPQAAAAVEPFALHISRPIVRGIVLGASVAATLRRRTGRKREAPRRVLRTYLVRVYKKTSSDAPLFCYINGNMSCSNTGNRSRITYRSAFNTAVETVTEGLNCTPIPVRYRAKAY